MVAKYDYRAILRPLSYMEAHMKYIGFKATPNEILLLEQLKKLQKRKTTADTLRALLLKEAEKFLKENTTIVVK